VPFINRADAGRRLARQLPSLRREDPVVLGLPRGGVPVAFEVAKALRAPLDVLVVRKLGVPFQPELAMGAIGEGGVRVINTDVVRSAQISDADIAAVEDRERAELQQRVRRLRTGTPRVPLADRTVIIVDDGIATGSTVRAACRVARAQHARKVVLAAPVGSAQAVKSLRRDADEVVCLEVPALFFAIGQWYEDFTQTSDEQVVDLLRRAAAWPIMVAAPQQGAALPSPCDRDEDVAIQAGAIELAGRLALPAGPLGMVVFVHGSGSSRFSPRNREVASALNTSRLGTLLFDLLTPTEELDRAHVFDIPLLAARLTAVTAWLRRQPDARDAPIGYFGASTGAAAALWAAARPDADVTAIVSRGGRPDLAGARLASVRAPTLLIVGGRDQQVLDLNRQAQDQLQCDNRLDVVADATHLFEEPGALAAVAGLAGDWFTEHMAKPGGPGSAGAPHPWHAHREDGVR
jgi:putative phosphoribosyl transferase